MSIPQPEIRVLGIEDVMPNRLTGTKPQFIPQAKYEQLSQYTVKAGDVLVTNMGTVGRACVVPPDLETSIMCCHLIKVSLEEDKVYPPYVCWALNCAPSVVAQIVANSHGAIMAGLTAGYCVNCESPSLPWQNSDESQTCWIVPRRCGLSDGQPSPTSTTSANPSSSTYSATR